MAPFKLPQIPASHENFIEYIANNPNHRVRELVSPYKDYESRLREGYAQHRSEEMLNDPYINIVPVFAGKEELLTTRARDPANDALNDQYIMPLKGSKRHPNGSPATAQSLKEFRSNFNLFSESSLVDIDWSNVVAAGSSVVTPMLPVPAKHKNSKRALRNYYHHELAPSSDVDLFLYGLDEESAIKKIAHIEDAIRNSILAETVTIRTKYAITIASQFPTRHVQVVLRVYKSISEILTGFDVDSACWAYDGKQVWSTPRGIAAFLTQTNEVDLSRRSPSYENRLAKYARRGFEVLCTELDRKRIDPTIFDRSLVRTLGLARLLILERLPTENDREDYQDQRRRERGRPPLDFNALRQFKNRLPGNKKDVDPQDIPDWRFDDDVSDYHTFTVPYGPMYHARKIEKLLYVKDLLLNAEWNQQKREVNLHRHPCFIGDVRHIVHDCCGECPKPTTDEELKVAEEESKKHISGKISFLIDDPGRQQIGSFNPLTEHDWTDMAYLGNTQVLCEAISDGDLEAVRTWLEQEDNDVNHRDHTGRMPLHFAIMCAQPEIVRLLVEKGARITSRIVDGFTSLHMAAAVGNAEIIKILAEKSEANEEMEAKKEDARKAERRAAGEPVDAEMSDAGKKSPSEDAEMVDAEDEDEDGDGDEDDAMTQGSFVKVKGEEEAEKLPEDDDFGPDFFDINVLAWDVPISPLHVAILGGQIDCIEALVSSFGADVLMPVKKKEAYENDPKVLLTLVLAAKLLDKESASTVKKLIELGAKPSQSDSKLVSALHGSVILGNVEALKVMFENDLPSSKTVVNFLSADGSYYYSNYSSPLLSAIKAADVKMVELLLDSGAEAQITYEHFREALLRANDGRHVEKHDIEKRYHVAIEQPIILAARTDSPHLITRLIEAGADINAEDASAGRRRFDGNRHQEGNTVCDILAQRIRSLKGDLKPNVERDPPTIKDDNYYLKNLKPGSYEYTMASRDVELARLVAEAIRKDHQENLDRFNSENEKAKRQKKQKKITQLEKVLEQLKEKGAKTFLQLYPEYKKKDSKKNEKEASVDIEEVYEPSLSFKDSRISKRKEKAYTKLFNAVWENDLETVKALTLKDIDDGEEEPLKPLPISTANDFQLTPFAIAICKGYPQMARTILDIIQAQYRPSDEKKPKRRFRIRTDDDDYEYDSDADSDMEIPIESEIIDKEVTIDDLAKLNEVVGCGFSVANALQQGFPTWYLSGEDVRSAKEKFGQTIPDTISFYSWDNFARLVGNERCSTDLKYHAVVQGDLAMFKFLSQAAREAGIKYGDSDHALESALTVAIDKGYKPLVEEIITTTGAGMPLNGMADSLDLEDHEKEKPKYYQGLKLYGKRKEDWTREASGERQVFNDWRSLKASPALRASHNQSLQVVQFWLSKTPERLYTQYGRDHQEDNRIQLLSKKSGGWNKVVGQWLRMRQTLCLHSAIMGNQDTKDLDKIEFLMRALPDGLEKKASGGWNPLLISYAYLHAETAELLIKSGADQTARNLQGMNLLHVVLNQPVKNRYEELDKLISLIDKRLLKEMFAERSKLGPTGTTPLAAWLYSTHDEETFEIIEKYVPEDVFAMFDGSGQTPLHVMVLKAEYELIEKVVKKRPHLMALENGAGQTALELAYILYLRLQIDSQFHVHNVEKLETYYTLKKLAAEHPEVKRKMISVRDATEVAKRLAERKSSGDDDDDDVGEQKVEDEDRNVRDEVQQWFEPQYSEPQGDGVADRVAELRARRSVAPQQRYAPLFGSGRAKYAQNNADDSD